MSKKGNLFGKGNFVGSRQSVRKGRLSEKGSLPEKGNFVGSRQSVRKTGSLSILLVRSGFPYYYDNKLGTVTKLTMQIVRNDFPRSRKKT